MLALVYELSCHRLNIHVLGPSRTFRLEGNVRRSWQAAVKKTTVCQLGDTL